MSLIDRFRGAQRPQADAGSKAAAPLPTALKPDGADPEVDLLLSQIDERLGHATEQGDSDLAESDMIVSRFVTDEELDAATAKPAAAAATASGDLDDAVTLPLLGHRSVAQHQRVLLALVVAGVVGVVAIGAMALSASSQQAGQLTATGQALMQSQRLAKSVSQALVGNPAAFPEVKDSSSVLVRNIKGLDAGGDGIAAVSGGARDALTGLLPMMERAEKRSADVLSQQETLTNVGQALRQINRQSSDLLEVAETVSSLKLQSGASAAELSAVGQLVMLTQRIGKSANEFLTLEGVSPEAVFLLGKDLNTFREITDGLLKGNADLRLPGTRDPATRERLEQLSTLYEQTRKQASTILGSLQGLAAAREAQSGIVADSEPLRKGLEQVQEDLQSASGLGVLRGVALLLAAVLAVAGGLGLLRLYVFNQALRARQAEEVANKAEAQERDAKRVNDANQAAILRLMNELQTVAEGDLTHQATVTEDITGAIADSVNYTVEELRTLVAQVQNAVARVTDTTTQVEATSTELLAASSEQLREILETGESVLKMASRINEVSAQAQQTAQVARQSLAVSDTGRKAVSDTIDGMNQLRENIQETAKRIKRLGESSQEIGEITELISDITEQTNVLALNAAIQAASAGEAGRGFSVVAEEVQRLAERSGDATRQIAALVKTIQTDTQDAVAAMEQSTQGVVQNAKLSDAAGSALGDIDRVTRRLSELIEQISSEARREAESANVVAANIQHIFAVTEQTGDGTRSTAQMVHELARTADELRRSVDRFKIA